MISFLKRVGEQNVRSIPKLIVAFPMSGEWGAAVQSLASIRATEGFDTIRHRVHAVASATTKISEAGGKLVSALMSLGVSLCILAVEKIKATEGDSITLKEELTNCPAESFERMVDRVLKRTQEIQLRSDEGISTEEAEDIDVDWEFP